MLQKVLRRPSPGTVLALVALVMAVTPIANAFEGGKPAGNAAATKKKKKAAVPARARFADNADKVDGYSVSYAGRPGYLVPLGPDGKFPRNVIPTTAGTTTTGGTGSTGPQGPPGAPAFTSERLVFEKNISNGADTNVPASGSAMCAADERIVGGGYENRSSIAFPRPRGSVDEVVTNKPTVLEDGRTGWFVQMVNKPPEVDPATGDPVTTPAQRVVMDVWAVCVK